MDRKLNLVLDHPKSSADYSQILSLQQDNLERTLGQENLEQGFVTVRHDEKLLQEMNAAGRHAIARDQAQIVGYALCMTIDFAERIPVLRPMFKLFHNTEFFDKKSGRSQPLSLLRYFVMGQVCIAQEWRGKGLFDALYGKLREMHAGNFDAVVTEVASRNVRSLHAHKRVGFETIKTYSAPLESAIDGSTSEQENWEILLWDWR